MAAPGNASRKGAAEEQVRPMKAREAVGEQQGAYQGTPRPAGATQHTTEVLHQRRKVPLSPAKAAVGGFAVVAMIAYFTLYSKKKPEATAIDVAKVSSGAANPKNTRPR